MKDDILDAIEKLNDSVNKFVAAKNDLLEAVAKLEAARIFRPDELDIDWETPDQVWLNGFACIYPTDEFAAEVGHSIIKTVMQAHPQAATFRVKAS